ncbi:MAG TPA: hypothetical protein VND91_05320, partial [Candidatus Saccharimonadia bacterium]|nr:hypothetical protein [Candidatus Saccharimonadia bacterium]
DDAAAAYGRCLAIKPEHRDARVGRGVALLQSMKFDAAMPDLEWWVAKEPDNADAWRAYGEALELVGRFDETAAAREREVALDPATPGRRRDAGLAFARMGLNDRARELLQDAASDPDDLVARWVAWQSLPLVYGDEATIEHWRAQWIEGLAALEQVDPSRHPRESLETAVFAATPFVLHYHGGDPAPLQRRYGALVTRWTRGLAADATPRAQARAQGKLRIGFATAYFHGHTVRGLFHQWLARLDRSRFTVVAIYLSGLKDSFSESLGEIADEVVRDVREPGDWVRAICAADLDAIVWLDLGMHGLSQLLSAVRMAPVTAMAWGHPITSGLDSVDHFLTADAMEPAGAAAHYTEKLVRLPKLGIRFPYPLASRESRRAARDSAAPPRLVCVQSVFKLHPLNLDLFARIAARLPRAELHFVPHPAPVVRAQFESLLRERFAAHGASFDARVQIHPGLRHEAFLALLAHADVFLDTIGWSGGHTTLEALATDLPVVTCPGAFMRQRHTLGMLELMDLDAELAVDDEDAYVDRVALLALDVDYHAHVVARIRERKWVLYDDDEPVRALERFLLQACGRVLPSPSGRGAGGEDSGET